MFTSFSTHLKFPNTLAITRLSTYPAFFNSSKIYVIYDSSSKSLANKQIYLDSLDSLYGKLISPKDLLQCALAESCNVLARNWESGATNFPLVRLYMTSDDSFGDFDARISTLVFRSSREVIEVNSFSSQTMISSSTERLSFRGITGDSAVAFIL